MRGRGKGLCVAGLLKERTHCVKPWKLAKAHLRAVGGWKCQGGRFR